MKNNIMKNKTINSNNQYKVLITGGTGSLGRALTKKLLEFDVKSLRIFSRNESKHAEMQSEFGDPRLRFLIGDVRDQTRLGRAVEDVDIVFHAAALKHVPLIESMMSPEKSAYVLASLCATLSAAGCVIKMHSMRHTM